MLKKIITSVLFGVLFLGFPVKGWSALAWANRDLVEPLVDSPGKTVGSDFNGDGIHDVVMGAQLQDDGPGDNAGAVYILYGTGSFSSTYQLNGAGVDVTILGKATGDYLGCAICLGSAGDINADGFDDIAAGAIFNNDGPGADDAGAVYILYGSPNFSSTYELVGGGVDVTILGKAANNYFGRSVLNAGDVNGDGFDDVIMSGQGNDDGALNAGAAYILYGSGSLSSTIQLDGAGVNVTILGKAANDELGAALGSAAGAGDINEDGFDDVIVGARLNNDGGTDDEGAAYILFGSSTLSGTFSMGGNGANVTVLGTAANDYLGRTTRGVGDINGDGFEDVGIAAHLADFSGATSGAAYVYYGRTFSDSTINTATAGADITIVGRAANHNLGAGLSGGGDLNDDGIADLLIGAYNSDDGPGANDDGALYVIYGSPNLASNINAGNSDVTVLGKAAIDRLSFGGSSGVGDVNNDGFADFIVGAHYNNDGPGANNAGAAYIIFGSDSLASTIRTDGAGPNVTVLGKAALDQLGVSVGGGRTNTGP